MNLDEPTSQTAFALAVGVTPAAISDLVRRGHLPAGATAGDWLRVYCANLRAQAAGRAGDLDLSQERAALARVHREIAELKKAQLAGTLVLREPLNRLLFTAARTMRDLMLGIGPRLAVSLVGVDDPKVIERRINDEARAALNAFAQQLRSGGYAEAGEPCLDDSAATENDSAA